MAIKHIDHASLLWDEETKTHTHLICDPNAGTFNVFVYGNESGGIQANTYSYRIFLVY